MNIKVLCIFFLLILFSCNSKVILKTSYFEGEPKKLTRYFEYNTKEKQITKIETQDNSIQRFKLKNKDKKFIANSLKRLNINENFCWISYNTPSEYYYKYEIIFNENIKEVKCITDIVRSEINETYHAIRDTIKRRIK